jgi:hypothetical protein
MTPRRTLCVAVVALIALWSAAAWAQTSPSIPVDLTGGGSITWPSAIVASAWLLTRSWSDTVIRASAGLTTFCSTLERLQSTGRPLIRISVDDCTARVPEKP